MGLSESKKPILYNQCIFFHFSYHFASMSAIDEQGVEKLSTQHLLQEGAYKGPLYGINYLWEF
jgi:hypothetical protein